MSLINKMLQDLDARGTPAAESFPSQIRPVARERAGLAERVDRRTVMLAAGGGVAVCALATLAWFGWGHYQQSRPGAKPAAVAAAAAPAQLKPAPAAVKPEQGMSSTITMGPASAAPAAPAEAPAAQSKSVAGYEPDSEEARAARQAIMAELQSRMPAASTRPAAVRHESKHESKRAKKHRQLAEEREHKPAKRAKAAADAGTSAVAAKGKRAAQGIQESGPQRAEGEYRHALNALQDGRMTETIAALEQTLKLDPAHDAARQTLVGLLIEAKRNDDAIRHLQAGLALDARQPSLAMLLARLQIERGGSGIDTLTRTLPYAGNHADYHAFLAGALQREQRHREAAEQYQAALRAAPGNGVWWMGLGMSLQAEKRNAEALEAFQRARASGSLSGELLAFVERRLQQLAR
jgi:MSHA biogenesis protein MshN